MSALDAQVLCLIDALIPTEDDDRDLEARIAPVRALLTTAQGTDTYDALFVQLAHLAVELGNHGHIEAQQALVGTLLGIEARGVAEVGAAALRLIGQSTTHHVRASGPVEGATSMLALRAASRPSARGKRR